MHMRLGILCLAGAILAGCQSSGPRNVPAIRLTQPATDRAQLDRDFRPLTHAAPEKQEVAASPVAQPPAAPAKSDPHEVPELQLVAAQLSEAEPFPTLAPVPPPTGIPVVEPPAPEAPTVGTTAVVGSGGMTLAEFEHMALAQNPSIQQGAALAAKAAGIRHQVGRRPNPTVGYQAQQLIDRGTDQHLVFVEQDFVTGKKLALGERVIDQEIQVQLWEVEAQRQRVLTDVRQAFYQALAAQNRRQLAGEFLGTEEPAAEKLLPPELQGIARKGVERAEERKRVGEGIDIEILQAEIQLQEVDLVLQRATFAKSAAWKELSALTGVPCLSETTLLGTLPEAAPSIDWDAKACELETCSPEIRAACMRVARAQANLDRQQVQAIPNVNVQMAGGWDNGTGSNMMNLQVGIPLPVHNANGGNISAAYAEFCEAGQNLERLKAALRQRLAPAARDYDSASLVVARYREVILPRAARTLDLSERGYATQGTIDFLQVLVARRTFFDAMLQLNESQLELAQAQALIDGLLLTGGLDAVPGYVSDDGLRGQALSGQ